MAKVQLKSDNTTTLGEIFSIMVVFSNLLEPAINHSLGLPRKSFGCQHGEILRALACVYFCGGSYVEDVTRHLMQHLCLHPTPRTCSSDTIPRAIRELSEDNISYTPESGKSYKFNAAERMGNLLTGLLVGKRKLEAGESIRN